LCIGGGAYLTVAMEPTATSWVVSYTPVDPATLVSIGAEIIDPNLYTFSGDSAVTDLDAGSWLWKATDSNGCSIENYFIVDCGTVGPVGGCTDPAATNYYAGATVDDGSCTYATVYGCTDTTAVNHDPLATVNATSATDPTNPCIYCNYGCTDPTAQNYYAGATCDDGSCIASVYGCTDPLALNYYAGANIDDGSCCYVAGCTDSTATNYDPLACYNDGSCSYVNGPCIGTTSVASALELELETHDENRVLVNTGDPSSMGDGFPGNGLVSNSAICGVTTLDLSNGVDGQGSYIAINDLTGIESFIALNHFTCNSNQLTNLDVSQNTLLNFLVCSFNQLTSLDVSNNIALITLSCNNNQLTTLDVSANTLLTWLDCQDNNITNLYLGSAINLATLNLYALNNTGLVIHVGTAARVAAAINMPIGPGWLIPAGTTFVI
jgi:hypothetical protein